MVLYSKDTIDWGNKHRHIASYKTQGFKLFLIISLILTLSIIYTVFSITPNFSRVFLTKTIENKPSFVEEASQAPVQKIAGSSNVHDNSPVLSKRLDTQYQTTLLAATEGDSIPLKSEDESRRHSLAQTETKDTSSEHYFSDDETDIFRILDEPLIPQFYFPFATGQTDGDHTIGVQISTEEMPRTLHLHSDSIEHQILHGLYDLMMANDEAEMPHLFHGRPIWTKIAAGESYHLYYDHDNHNWVINSKLEFHSPTPLARIPHAAALPISAEHAEEGLQKYSFPEGIEWEVRNLNQNDIFTKAALKIKPISSVNAPNLAMQLNKIFLAMNGIEDPFEDEVEDEDEEEDEDEDEDEDWNEGKYYNGQRKTKGGGASSGMYFAFPGGGKGEANQDTPNDRENEMQNESLLNTPLWNLERDEVQAGNPRPHHVYWTFISPEVYHTFEDKHQKFNHNEIYDNPVGQLKTQILESGSKTKSDLDKEKETGDTTKL